MSGSDQQVETIVYLLWHTDVYEDAKLIGVYDSEANAKAAIARTWALPGFAEPGGEFEIAPYPVNKDHWTSGFVRDAGCSIPAWVRTSDSSENE